jgi:UMF1 family MFS transporter
MVFCYLGSFCNEFILFRDKTPCGLGLGTVLASIGFGNRFFIILYLPEIAFPEQQDRVSAKGFMFGYAGSLILLGFNLTMVMMPEWYGISDGSLPAIFFFIGWHCGLVLHKLLLSSNIYKESEKDYIFKGLRA